MAKTFDPEQRAIEAGVPDNTDLDLAAADNKAQTGVALLLSGASYTDIARMAGYRDAKTARIAVEAVLANTADSPEEIEKLRIVQDRRYKRLLQSVMGKAVDPKDPDHLAYNARALAIVDRISKLHGVDAPQQVTITPTDAAIQEFVRQMLPHANADNAAVEADIFDEGERL